VLAGLGVPVDLAGNALGDDAEGREIHRYLRKIGVGSMLLRRRNFATPFCQCLVQAESGDREFILRHDGIQEASAALWSTAAERALQGRYSHAFVQAYLEELSFLFLRRTREVPMWILTQDVEARSPFVPRVDAVQLSLLEGLRFDEKSAWKQAKPYFRGRLSQVFLTSGSRGVALCERGGRVTLFPAVRARRVVDTTGCGDAFRAGLMAGLWRGLSMRDSIRLGGLCGARKAELYGSHFSDGLPRGTKVPAAWLGKRASP
jgi:sugar/nucleoside kinase (ribokinase family)